jgi:hypothetical protein
VHSQPILTRFPKWKWLLSEVNHSRLEGHNLFPGRMMGINVTASESSAIPGGIKLA